MNEINKDNKNNTQPVSSDEQSDCCAKQSGEESVQDSTQLEALKQELQACQQATQAWKEKYIRESADLENFKKRIAKEQASWTIAAQAEVLKNVLSIIDDFDRAFVSPPATDDKELQSWIDGMAMIHQSFHKFLEAVGVQEVPCKRFDPMYHEALIQVESQEHKEGDIVEVLQKGYMLKGIVLRPAKVSVSK